MLVAVVELATDVGHPDDLFIFAQPVVATNANHGPAKLALPALTVGAERGEGFTVDVGNASDTRHGRVTAVSRELSVTGNSHVKSQSLTGKGEHHENKVGPNDPQRADKGDTLETLRLTDSIPQAIRSR